MPRQYGRAAHVCPYIKICVLPCDVYGFRFSYLMKKHKIKFMTSDIIDEHSHPCARDYAVYIYSG
jgi:hypothetical protein